MVVATLIYNASSGSDTAASGSNAPTTAHTQATLSATVSGTAATTTMTFSATIDLTGVNNDGTDVIWTPSTSGERHLFRITAFTGGVSTCTGLTVAETIGASGLSAANWAIGGKRQGLENDTSRTDIADAIRGWEFALEDGTYTNSTAWIWTQGGDATSGPSILRAAAGVSAKPVIQNTAASSADILRLSDSALSAGVFHVYGLKFSATNASFTGNVIHNQGARPSLWDLAIVGTGTGGVGIKNSTTNQCCASIRDCYVEDFAYGIDFRTGSDSTIIIDGNTITGSSSAGIYLGNSDQSTTIVIDNQIYETSGDGVLATAAGSLEQTIVIRGNTVADCTGDGFDLQGIDQANRVGIWVENNLSAYNGGYGFIFGSQAKADYLAHFGHNATYNNTSGAVDFTPAINLSQVVCTANPFQDRANDNYKLNNTAGGGAACKDAGFPGEDLPDGT